MALYSGQKVVCVDDGPSIHGIPCDLVKGDIYTVLSTGEQKGIPYVTLHEVEPHQIFYVGFRASRFRPAVDRPTDISVFTQMLKPKSERVE